ncbi:ectoine hydroxylase [Dasania marina]|uniref:ectoine hydroxylase n=1 Tax=Dasania marina TaxID=471499 RepID=UPI00036BCC1A|nr:ectoine hydroxylase [Dasania marina]
MVDVVMTCAIASQDDAVGNSYNQDNSFAHNSDDYASRDGKKTQLIARKDPVVYRDDYSQAPVTEQHIKHYQQHGYMVLDDVFSEQEIERLNAELQQLRVSESIKSARETITEHSSGDVRSIFAVHNHSALFKQLSEDPRLVDLARFILDDDVYIHQSRLNYKPGYRGKDFYWHSDFETWHVEDGMPRMRALSMSISLTENYGHNGPLMLVPDSHQQYAVCEGYTPDNHHRISLKKQEYGVPSDACLSTLIDQGDIATAVCKPGSVIVFDCNTMHGSNSNITPYPRSNAFFVYNALSNQVQKPFCDRPARPEYVCTREAVTAIKTHKTNA